MVKSNAIDFFQKWIASLEIAAIKPSQFSHKFQKTIYLQNFTARMIWTVTTKEFAITGCVYVSLDGKNKQIVQVHNCEKAYQTFNTVTNLYHFHLFFAPEFFCLDDSHCNEKGSCNNVLGNCACEEGMSGFLDCTFCKFWINVPFERVSFSASPSSGQLEPVLPIFGSDSWQNITN